jgi:hypothetical protein
MCQLCSAPLPRPRFVDQMHKCCYARYIVESASDGTLYWTEFGYDYDE